MIDPSELRKGNIVEYNGEHAKVVGFDEEYVYLNIITVDYVGFNEVFPVELTEKFLLDFGFEFSNDMENGRATYDEWTFKDYGLTKTKKGFEMYPFLSYVKTIHKLQNLFYVLCEEELKLTN